MSHRQAVKPNFNVICFNFSVQVLRSIFLKYWVVNGYDVWALRGRCSKSNNVVKSTKWAQEHLQPLQMNNQSLPGNLDLYTHLFSKRGNHNFVFYLLLNVISYLFFCS